MNAAAYLAKQGWRGEGYSLDSTGRGLAKPLLVQHKVDFAGLGTKKNDFSNQWWLNAFDKSLGSIGSGASTPVSDQGSSLPKTGLYARFVRAAPLESTIKEVTIKPIEPAESLISATSSSSSDSDSDSDSSSSSSSSSSDHSIEAALDLEDSAFEAEDMAKTKPTREQRGKKRKASEAAEGAAPKKKSRKDLVKEGKIRKKQEKRALKLAKKGIAAPTKPRGKFSAASVRRGTDRAPAQNANMEPLGSNNKFVVDTTPTPVAGLPVPPRVPAPAPAPGAEAADGAATTEGPKVKHLKPGSKAEKYARERAMREAKRALRIANGEEPKPKKKKKSSKNKPASVLDAAASGTTTQSTAAGVTEEGASAAVTKKSDAQTPNGADMATGDVATNGAPAAADKTALSGDFISLGAEGPADDAALPWEEKVQTLKRRGKLERGAKRKGVSLEEFVTTKAKKSAERAAKKLKRKEAQKAAKKAAKAAKPAKKKKNKSKATQFAPPTETPAASFSMAAPLGA